MKTQSAIILALSATVSAHGVVMRILGENNVEMPGLTSKSCLLFYAAILDILESLY